MPIASSMNCRPALASPSRPASLLDLRAGTIQPLAYVRGLASAAIATGARVFTGCPVETIAREGSVWRLATPGGVSTEILSTSGGGRT